MASQFPLTPSKLESDDVKIFCDDVKVCSICDICLAWTGCHVEEMEAMYVLGYTCSGQLYSLIVLADNDDDEEEFLDADETLVDTMT
ncbi:hypothetical protein Tco_0798584 [Tanacetum coccineum]